MRELQQLTGERERLLEQHGGARAPTRRRALPIGGGTPAAAREIEALKGEIAAGARQRRRFA